ncbi:acyltransferase [Streptococcus sp. Marseille-Q8145]
MKKIRNINLDLIKIIACIGVVLLHTTMPGFKETGQWNYSSYLYYLGTYSIPLFFMVNGYLLLGKSKITYPYILHKIKWILITVSSWTVIIWLLKRDFTNNPIKKILASLIQKGYFFQFWFFGSLILIYLCLPILKKYLYSKRSYLYFLSVLTIIGLIFELINFCFKCQCKFMLYRRLDYGLGFYYILGGFVAQFNIDNLKSIFKGWMKVVSTLLLLISPKILFFIAKNTYHNLFAEYFYDNLLVKVISLGLFLILLTLTIDAYKFRMIYLLSVQTMGVFIIHTYVMKIWQKLIGFNIVGAYLFFPVFTLMISFLISMTLMKIPYINRIVKI